MQNYMLRSVTDKSPSGESSTYDKSSLESQSTPDSFIDSLEAILEILIVGREKKISSRKKWRFRGVIPAKTSFCFYWRVDKNMILT